MKTRHTRVSLTFVYSTDEETESIPLQLVPGPGRGINDFIVGGLKAFGITEGEVAPGAQWALGRISSPKLKRTKKAIPEDT